MELVVHIPDKAAGILSTLNGDLAREVLEGYALEGYRSGRLTAHQVQELLGFETGMEVDAFLNLHNAPLELMFEDPEEGRKPIVSEVATMDNLVVSVQRKLLEISQSEPDWDSYGAQPTSLDAVRKAEELFTQIANQFYFTKGEKTRPYDVAPLTNGGVQLEWRSLSGALEVEVHPSIGFRYLLVQGQGDNRQFKEGHNVSASEIIRLVSGILNGHDHPQSNNP
jgi:hypothetical protein